MSCIAVGFQFSLVRRFRFQKDLQHLVLKGLFQKQPRLHFLSRNFSNMVDCSYFAFVDAFAVFAFFVLDFAAVAVLILDFRRPPSSSSSWTSPPSPSSSWTSPPAFVVFFLDFAAFAAFLLDFVVFMCLASGVCGRPIWTEEQKVETAWLQFNCS